MIALQVSCLESMHHSDGKRLQYQDASTIFKYSEGWERAYVLDDSGLVVVEGAGFSSEREYKCQFFDKANLEVRSGDGW